MSLSATVAGWIPDPDVLPDGFQGRPFSKSIGTFSSVMKSSPGTDYDIPSNHPVYDQGGWGSCVANAALGAMNIVLEVQNDKTDLLSRMFLYWLCRLKMGTTDQDSGTYMYMAVDRVGNIGCCSEKTWSYADEHMFKAPGQECYPEASDNKATAWFTVKDEGQDRLEQLEIAVRSNHPFIFGTPVDASILPQNYSKGMVLTTPSGAYIGGHAMVGTGVRYINGQRVWRIRNSWGWWYGDNGHLYIDDAFMSWALLRDIWVLTRMDALLF